MPERIFIVDDHPMMHEGLARLLVQEGWEICGGAANADEALNRVMEARPDILILDISLPGKNGLELLKDLLALSPKLSVLVFSMHDEMLYAERVMRAGAKGYIMKDESADELLKAIRAILSGGVYLSPTVSSHLLRNLAGTRARGQIGLDRLTDRELEVFEMVGRGKSNQQISEQLRISPRTVDAHRTHIKTKLGLPDAAALMREAVLWIEHGKTGSSHAFRRTLASPDGREEGNGEQDASSGFKE
ncbi:response regulator transcription factor [Luteolibacter ambystomatis]|uniref:Response regulator transcription factor n=1 Tax=Luteolibacter ambystomatis TaxID=2824561 RepID=A0A975J3D5_9BACT|nr:response regulator transcription factor [Luteolibacter ambystomatis]QUE53237.1 response regulator transcription factor [Luteolibacter ambystomatis]